MQLHIPSRPARNPPAYLSAYLTLSHHRSSAPAARTQASLPPIAALRRSQDFYELSAVVWPRPGSTALAVIVAARPPLGFGSDSTRHASGWRLSQRRIPRGSNLTPRRSDGPQFPGATSLALLRGPSGARLAVRAVRVSLALCSQNTEDRVLKPWHPCCFSSALGPGAGKLAAATDCCCCGRRRGRSAGWRRRGVRSTAGSRLDRPSSLAKTAKLKARKQIRLGLAHTTEPRTPTRASFAAPAPLSRPPSCSVTVSQPYAAPLHLHIPS